MLGAQPNVVDKDYKKAIKAFRNKLKETECDACVYNKLKQLKSALIDPSGPNTEVYNNQTDSSPLLVVELFNKLKIDVTKLTENRIIKTKYDCLNLLKHIEDLYLNSLPEYYGSFNEFSKEAKVVLGNINDYSSLETIKVSLQSFKQAFNEPLNNEKQNHFFTRSPSPSLQLSTHLNLDHELKNHLIYLQFKHIFKESEKNLLQLKTYRLGNDLYSTGNEVLKFAEQCSKEAFKSQSFDLLSDLNSTLQTFNDLIRNPNTYQAESLMTQMNKPLFDATPTAKNLGKGLLLFAGFTLIALGIALMVFAGIGTIPLSMGIAVVSSIGGMAAGAGAIAIANKPDHTLKEKVAAFKTRFEEIKRNDKEKPNSVGLNPSDDEQDDDEEDSSSLGSSLSND